MKPHFTAFQFPLNNVCPLSFSLALRACTWYNALIWNISINFSNQGFLKSLILQEFSRFSLLSHYLIVIKRHSKVMYKSAHVFLELFQSFNQSSGLPSFFLPLVFLSEFGGGLSLSASFMMSSYSLLKASICALDNSLIPLLIAISLADFYPTEVQRIY